MDFSVAAVLIVTVIMGFFALMWLAEPERTTELLSRTAVRRVSYKQWSEIQEKLHDHERRLQKLEDQITALMLNHK